MLILLKLQLNIFLTYYEKIKEIKLFYLLLKVLSLLFFVCYKTRLLLYKLKILKSYTLDAYVISVGNITSGGTGKTPVVIEGAKYFLSLGYKVAVLSRAYNIDINDKIILVSDGNDILVDSNICGDEPNLIAKSVPKAIVIVGKDRLRAGNTAIRLGANVLILDDGFQYLKLNKNENILIIDSYSPFDNGNLLPLGKLRELPDSINRSTSIIISNTNLSVIKPQDYEQIKKYAFNIPIAKSSYKLTGFNSLNTKKRITVNDAKGMKVIAFSGIGNPQSFIDTLKRNEINVLSHITFFDHYKYEFRDIEQLASLTKRNNLSDIITTEKDAVKVEELCQALPVTFWSANIEIQWETHNLFETISSKIVTNL